MFQLNYVLNSQVSRVQWRQPGPELIRRGVPGLRPHPEWLGGDLAAEVDRAPVAGVAAEFLKRDKSSILKDN